MILSVLFSSTDKESKWTNDRGPNSAVEKQKGSRLFANLVKNSWKIEIPNSLSSDNEQLKFIMIKNKSWSYLIYWQRIKKDWRLRTKTQTLPSKIKKAFGGPGESAFLHWPETGPAVWPAGLCHWTQQQIILQCLTSWNVFNTRCCCCGQTCYRPLTCWRQVHTLAQRHSKHWTRTLIWFLGLIWNKNVIVRIWFKLHLPMEWLPLTCKQSVTTQALSASKYLK